MHLYEELDEPPKVSSETEKVKNALSSINLENSWIKWIQSDFIHEIDNILSNISSHKDKFVSTALKWVEKILWDKVKLYSKLWISEEYIIKIIKYKWNEWEDFLRKLSANFYKLSPEIKNNLNCWFTLSKLIQLYRSNKNNFSSAIDFYNVNPEFNPVKVDSRHRNANYLKHACRLIFWTYKIPDEEYEYFYENLEYNFGPLVSRLSWVDITHQVRKLAKIDSKARIDILVNIFKVNPNLNISRIKHESRTVMASNNTKPDELKGR